MAQQVLVLVLGILGNIASVISFVGPAPTFIEIWRGTSVFQYRPLPYIISLLCQLIWLEYGCLLQDGAGLFIIVVSVLGCLFQTGYICAYLFYATADIRRRTIRFVVVVDVLIFIVFFLITFIVIRSTSTRESIVGWSCVVIQTASFASPLTAVWQVVQTHTVESMPFALSLSLTINATMWLAYGFVTHDIYIEIPNILGVVLGITQIAIYVYYRFIYHVVQTARVEIL